MPNLHSNISFGLVNIPIIMNPVIKNNDTSFNQLHKTCLHRVKYIKYCTHCKKDLKESDIVKGYMYEREKYIVFKKDELDKLKPENEKEINIISFVNIDEVDPVYYEKSYVLQTEKKGSKAYNLFCEALRKTNMGAIARTVIGSKFYYVLLRFNDSVIIMSTLFFQEEINLPSDEKNISVNSKELNLAIKLINENKGKFEPQKYIDEYQNNIKDAIEDKMNGKSVKKTTRKQKEQVSDLFEALEKSLKKK